MKRKLALILVFALVLTMALPMTAFAGSNVTRTYQLKATLTGPDKAGIVRTVAAYSTAYATKNEPLVASLYGMVNKNKSILQATFDETYIGSGAGKIYLGSVLNEGISAYLGTANEWRLFTAKYDAYITGDLTMQNALKEGTATLGSLEANTKYSICFGNKYVAEFTVTVVTTRTASKHYSTVAEVITPSDTPSDPVVVTPSDVNMVDVPSGSWYASPVAYVLEKGLMVGTGNSRFSPDANVTRGMLMTILARAAGANTEGGKFWYSKGQTWVKEKGISDGTNPEGTLSREMLATMFYRAAGTPVTTGSLEAYVDSSSVSGYAKVALQWAVEKGIVNGKSGMRLDPQGNATRAEVAAMLQRYCEQ